MKTNHKRIEDKLRTVAAFAETGSDLEGFGDKQHADTLFAGAHWIFANAKTIAHAPELLEALKMLMEDYATNYSVLTNDTHGKEPGGKAWSRAKRLVKKLSVVPAGDGEGAK